MLLVVPNIYYIHHTPLILSLIYIYVYMYVVHELVTYHIDMYTFREKVIVILRLGIHKLNRTIESIMMYTHVYIYIYICTYGVN